jgi:predicted transcriptional regulator
MMKNTDITTVRLPQELDRKLETYSDLLNTTKSDVIKEALQSYFTRMESERDSWEVGEAYFGKYGSGDGTLSVTYKKRIKEKLHDKHTR